MVKICDHCQEQKNITHWVRSEILNMLVCRDCAIEAIEINDQSGIAGAMTIVPLEQPFAC